MRTNRLGQILIMGAIVTLILAIVCLHSYYFYLTQGTYLLVLSIFLWLLGGSLWGWDWKRISDIKKNIYEIENLVGRAKSRIVEFNLGSEYEVKINSMRSELADLYLNPKPGEESRKRLAICLETANEIIDLIDRKDTERLELALSSLRDKIADVRSEFRR